MGIINSNKEINKKKINCGDSFNVKLSLSASPNIVENPTDIVLILDRSGSMDGDPLTNLKKGAKKFVEIIDEATDDNNDGQIGSGSRIGIVSFSETATKNTELITSVADLDDAIDSLVALGATNHEDAFKKAVELFDPNSSNARVIVMFTDGVTTAGGNPVPITDLAKSDGILIYCIGLVGSTGLNINTLNTWSSDPDSAYVVVTPDDEDLEQVFQELAENISNPGATDLNLIDTVDSCFQITGIVNASKGDAEILSDNSIKWNMDELGVTANEAATLEFTVKHIGNCSGMIKVNTDIEYQDNEGNLVAFPSPFIEVDCDKPVCIEECPTSIEIVTPECEDYIKYDAGSIKVNSLGTILELKVRIKDICPYKRVALAVILNELDCNNKEYQRGFKTMVIPAHTHPTCRDVVVECIKFVLPEELDIIDENHTMCNKRRFVANFIANYIDNNFYCSNN